MLPINIDGTDVSGITIDGTDVTEVTVDGDVVFAPSAIPDSVTAHYDFSKEDGSTPVTDQSGNGYDLSGQYSGVGGAINGVQAGEFDGSDDELDNANPSWSYPLTFVGVFADEVIDTIEVQTALCSDDEEWIYRHTDGFDNGESIIFAGSFVDGDIPDAGAQITTGVFDGTNSLIRQNGTQTGSGDTGSDPASGVRLGAKGGKRYFNGKIGEVLIYNRRLTSDEIVDVESYLSDKWGVTI